jgi:hypothetical protein
MSECDLAISAARGARLASPLVLSRGPDMRLLPALLLLITTLPALAQEDPSSAIRWSWTLQPADARPGSEAQLVLIAAIAPHWVVYSSDFAPGIGPLPTRLKKNTPSTLEFVDSLQSIGARRNHDGTSNAEYGYFAQRAELRQRVRLPADGSPVEVTLNGQACHEADGTCHLIRQDIRIAPVRPALVYGP